MKDISTMVKSHVIISVTHKHYFLTPEQHEKLKTASLDDMVATCAGVSIKCSAILEVLPIEKYYETYPEAYKNYGQPYTVYPGQGLLGTAEQVMGYNIDNAIAAFEKSLIKMPGNKTLQNLLQLAKDKKAGKTSGAKTYEPKYKNLLEYYKDHPEESTPEKLELATETAKKY